jgi:aldehyde:ferredoxin oxidoreductase
MYGWHNNFLNIDLSTKKTEKFSIDEDIFLKYIGGRGLGVYFLKDYHSIEPFDNDMIIAILTGPLTGTSGYSSGRFSITSRSPLTKTIFDSNSGGSFGYYLKKAGYDGIIIRGKSKKPVIIKIDNETVIIEDGSKIWGKNLKEVRALIPKGFHGMFIGTAGEKLSYLSNIGLSKENYFGRGGIGAVLGYKNLKGLIVRGDKKIKISDKERWKNAQKEIRRMIEASPTIKGLRKYGTSVLVSITDFMKIFPIRNFTERHSSRTKNLYIDKIFKNSNFRKKSCITCPIACKKYDNIGELPEFETVGLLGGSNLIFNYEIIVEANRILNDFGIDTISAGGTLASFYEYNGNFPKEEQFLKDIIELANRKSGFDELNYGSYRYLEKFKAEKLSMSVKKLELPAYDPRGVKGMALSYGTSNRGGCHLRSYMVSPEVLRKPRPLDPKTISGKAGYTMIFQNRFAITDSLSVCKFAFLGTSEEEYAELLSAETGIEFSGDGLLKSGQLIYDLEHEFNRKAGFTKEDDYLPERFYNDGGYGELEPIDYSEYKTELESYYKIRGYE